MFKGLRKRCDFSDRSVRFRIGAGGAMLIMIFDVFTLGFFLFGVAGSGMGCLPGHRTGRNGKNDSDDSGRFLWAEL